MSVVDTSTAGTATAGVNGRKVDRNQDGTLWTVFDNGAGQGEFWYSKDSGATWTYSGSGVDVAGVTHPALFIDLDDNAHLVWKQSGTGGSRTDQRVYYMRGTPNVGRTTWTWGTALEIAGAGGFNYDYPDLVAFRTPGASTWRVWIVLSMISAATNWAEQVRIDVSSGGTPTQQSQIILNSHGGLVYIIGGSYGVTNGHTFPTIDFNHTGDGKTVAGATPHLYCGWTAATSGTGKGIRFIKATFASGSWTWGTEVEIDSTRYVTGATNTWTTCLFDGTRVVVAGWAYTGTQYDVIAHERDAGDTTTTTRALLTNTAAADMLASGSVAWDVDGNLYAFGRDGTGANGTRKLNYRKWARSGATLGAIVTVESTASDTPYITARRGTGGLAVDIAYTDGTAGPYNVTFLRPLSNVTSTAPATPTVSATANNTLGRIVVTWVNPAPTGSQPAITGVDVYRRIGATGTALRMDAADTGTSWTDYRPAHQIDYRYMVRALGANGVTADSAWST